MGQFFANLVKFVTFIGLLGGIGWFVVFNTNPKLICIDHPDKQYKKTHFQCKPFGIKVEKPEPERKFRDGKY